MKNVFIIIFVGLSLNLYSQSKVQDVSIYVQCANTKSKKCIPDVFAKINTIGSYTIFLAVDGVNYGDFVVKKNRRDVKILSNC